MDIKVEQTKELKIKLKGDDCETFKSLVKKIHEQQIKVGFNNSPFNDDEKKLIDKMKDKF